MVKCYIDSQVGRVEITQEIEVPYQPVRGDFLRLHNEPEFERQVLQVTFIQQSDYTWVPCLDLGGIETVRGRNK